MALYNVVITTATKNGEWSGAVSSPTLVLDSDIQGILNAGHAECIVHDWLEATGLHVLDVSVSVR